MTSLIWCPGGPDGSRLFSSNIDGSVTKWDLFHLTQKVSLGDKIIVRFKPVNSFKCFIEACELFYVFFFCQGNVCLLWFGLYSLKCFYCVGCLI